MHPALCTHKCLPTGAMLGDSHQGVDEQPGSEACDSIPDLLYNLEQVGHCLLALGGR